MDTRKKHINEYKQRTITGGVYRVTNTCNGMYLLDYAQDIQSRQNRFTFMMSSGSCFHHLLQKDMEEFGGSAFVFEVLEKLDKKKEQSLEEYIDDLKMLAQLWNEKLDTTCQYR